MTPEAVWLASSLLAAAVGAAAGGAAMVGVLARRARRSAGRRHEGPGMFAWSMLPDDGVAAETAPDAATRAVEAWLAVRLQAGQQAQVAALDAALLKAEQSWQSVLEGLSKALLQDLPGTVQQAIRAELSLQAAGQARRERPGTAQGTARDAQGEGPEPRSLERLPLQTPEDTSAAGGIVQTGHQNQTNHHGDEVRAGGPVPNAPLPAGPARAVAATARASASARPPELRHAPLPPPAPDRESDSPGLPPELTDEEIDALPPELPALYAGRRPRPHRKPPGLDKL